MLFSILKAYYTHACKISLLCWSRLTLLWLSLFYNFVTFSYWGPNLFSISNAQFLSGVKPYSSSKVHQSSTWMIRTDRDLTIKTPVLSLVTTPFYSECTCVNQFKTSIPPSPWAYPGNLNSSFLRGVGNLMRWGI